LPKGEWRWYAITGFGGAGAYSPFRVFRYNGSDIERWTGGSGWVHTPSLLRYVMGYDAGADLIDENLANRLTGGCARNATGQGPHG